jgi:hypothetical protein
LNPITKYKLTGAAKALSTAEKWNIVWTCSEQNAYAGTIIMLLIMKRLTKK